MSNYFRPENFPDHGYDFYQYDPQKHARGLYESNYLKANSPDGLRAIWIKHNLLIWRDRKKKPIVELWGIFFERGEEPIVAKQEVPLGEVELKKDRLELKGKNIFLSNSLTETTVKDLSNTLSWKIAMEQIAQPPLIPLAYSWMYTAPFPKKKILTPAPESNWNGFFKINDRVIEIKNWTGYRAHNWGSEHAHRYAYGNCNLFAGAPRTYFDGYSAKLKIGPLTTPWLSNGIFRTQEHDVAMNGIGIALKASVKVDFPLWRVEWKRGKEKLLFEQSAPLEEFVGLIYHHPSGKVSYCYNTKFAHTRLHYQNDQEEKSFQSELGELEFLFSEPIPKIALHGD